MDISEYKDEFISEARDHLDILNDALLILEKDPDDMENINRIFRSFHTLKGNAAAMEFMRFSELAHALEDVMSKIRDKELEVSKNTMDMIFDGCDTLEQGLEDISNDKPENISIDGLISELKETLGAKEEAYIVNIGEKAELTGEDNKKIQEWKNQNRKIFRLIIVFDKNNQLKTAKAMLILRNISAISALIKTTPASEDIKAGKFDTEIELIAASELQKEEIEKIVNDISGLKHAFILGLDEVYNKPKETAHEEKELDKAAIANKHRTDVVKQIQSVKVDMKKLDKLMNLVGELLISNIRMQDCNKKKDYSALKIVLAEVDRLILELQEEVTEIRMVPIGNIFNRFPRMVRDLAEKEGKKINLIIEGQEIEFDRTVLDEIGDPLVHLLRNCVDHGIEKPEERIDVGKPEQGTVKLIAKREKNNAVIKVTDDGAGIDTKKVKEISIKKGIITEDEAAKMTDKEIQMLIFRAGFSTSEVITDVSGRGVGMDVVLNKIKELGGSLKLDSAAGKGTSVEMQLPLTLAIITAFLVKAGDNICAIPLTAVEETVDIKKEQIKTIQGNKVFILRESEVPLFWLHDIMGLKREEKDILIVMIVNRSGEKIGIVVDSIIAQQQILIKGLQDIVKGTKGIAGATIMGDGTVALILDIETLL